MRKAISVFLVGLGALIGMASALAQEGGGLYTQVNIWYEKPMKIPSTNYHVGAMLPVGTKVTLDNIEDDEIKFTDTNGASYRIQVVIKHNNVPGPALKDKLFGSENPMAEGGKFSKFSKEEQEQIRFGSIKTGMSKDAVIMAYGYPPTIRTPTLDVPSWTYWKNRFVTRIIRFDESGKAVEIQG